MNDNKNKISWCDVTLNPVVGCLHECPYCFAKKMGKRQKHRCMKCYDFTPHEHLDRLDQITPRQKPKKIFIDSMWDWNCKDNAHWWMEKIIEKMKECKQHTFQILSKRPIDYGFYDFPKNVWLGTSVTRNNKWHRIEELDKCQFPHKNLLFVSFEPLHGWMGRTFIKEQIQWVIVGAETGNRKDKTLPKEKWISSIVDNAKTFNIPIFMKNNLKPYWGGNLIQEFPKEDLK